ncbi:TPA: hypothetical protein H1009_04190 [archaeon]|nr:hypothetical protein [Candidatus Naiadarchaeales archaeon SRR2090153.bin461]
MWGPRKERHGTIEYTILPDKFSIEYPNAQKGEIVEAVIKGLEALFVSHKLGKLPALIKERLEKGETVSFPVETELMGLKLRIGRENCAVVGQSYEIVGELLANVQHHT